MKEIALDKEEDFFWEMIEKSNKKGVNNLEEYDVDEHTDRLTDWLSQQSKEALVVFEKVFLQKMDKLDTAEIAELSIIIENKYTNENGKVVFDEYVSTDGFVYFRCWLILKGKEFYYEITEDINAIVNGKYSFDIGNTWGEGLLYVSDKANMLTNKEAEEFEITDIVSEKFPEIIHYDSFERVLNRPLLGGDELQLAYPKLVTEMIKIK